MYMPNLSVIIPVLNAERQLPGLLNSLRMQTMPILEILVVDSGSTDLTVDIARKDPLARVLSVTPDTFDHGGTRHAAFLESKGDLVCFLTQDAVPADAKMLQNLTAPLTDPIIGCAFGRQIAKEGAGPVERITREYNYPAVSTTFGQADRKQQGVRAVFFSDVCSVYRRSAYLAVGGFERYVLTNEDMLIAVHMMEAGYHTAYIADACVYHSHAFSYREEFRRYFDIGAFLRMHRDALPDLRLTGEGMRYVRFVSKGLAAEGKVRYLLPFYVHCAFRFAGKLCGGIYPVFGKHMILRMTGNRGYWLREE